MEEAMAAAQAFLWGVMMLCIPSQMVLAGLIWAQNIGTETNQGRKTGLTISLLPPTLRMPAKMGTISPNAESEDSKRSFALPQSAH
jgi:hypothetical protein